MLTKAERKTRIMAKTPTKVLLVLDCTIFLERVWRGTGKSCMREKKSNRYIKSLFVLQITACIWAACILQCGSVCMLHRGWRMVMGDGSSGTRASRDVSASWQQAQLALQIYLALPNGSDGSRAQIAWLAGLCSSCREKQTTSHL